MNKELYRKSAELSNIESHLRRYLLDEIEKAPTSNRKWHKGFWVAYHAMVEFFKKAIEKEMDIETPKTAMREIIQEKEKKDE